MMLQRSLLFVAALLAVASLARRADAEEWTRNDARDEIVRKFGMVLPIVGKDDSLSYAIDLAPDLDDAAVLAPFAPIVELILAENNAEAALDKLKGSESLRSLSLDDPIADTLRKAAQFKNLKTLWLVGADEAELTTLAPIKGAKNLQGLVVEGYAVTKSAVEDLAQLDDLSSLVLIGDLRADAIKPLPKIKKLTALTIDDSAAQALDLAPIAVLQNLQTLSLQLGETQPLVAKDFEAIAALPKLERLDLGATPWKEEDLVKLKASRSLRLIACDSTLDADAAALLTKEFGLIRFVPYGPALNPIDDLKSPKVTALSLSYDETPEGTDPPPRDPAKQYLGNGLVAAEKPVTSADTIARLRKMLSDRGTYQHAESHDCYTPERALLLTENDVTVEVLFCPDCHYVEVHLLKAGDGLIPNPGEPVRESHSLSEAAGAELMAIVDQVLGK